MIFSLNSRRFTAEDTQRVWTACLTWSRNRQSVLRLSEVKWRRQYVAVQGIARAALEGLDRVDLEGVTNFGQNKVWPLFDQVWPTPHFSF